jgi:hypothetical protein
VPAEQVLRDLRINRIFEGSTEIMHLLIAREAVDAHLSVAGDIISPDADAAAKARAVADAGKFYARWLPTLTVGQGQLPTSFAEFGPLATHMRFAERSSRKLARATFYAMSRWQGSLEHKQGFLSRVVDIGAELFAVTATCSRALSDAERTPHQAQSAMELADVFSRQARVRIEALFTELWDNTDSVDAKLARRVMADHYTWIEDGIVDPSIPGPAIADATPGPSAKDNVRRTITEET